MSKAGQKPSPGAPKKKSNRDKVNEEIIKIKRKGGGGNKLPLILAVVGVVLLLGVGGLIFFLTGEDKPKPPPPRGDLGAGARRQPGGENPAGEAPPTAALDPAKQQKLQEFLARLDGEKDKDGAVKELEGRLKDGGETEVKFLVPELEGKAKKGNESAKELLRGASRMNENPLAQNLSRGALDRLGDSSASGAEAGDNPSNLLPIDTQAVLALSVKKLLSSGFERGLFTFGAFRFADFETRLGVTLSNIDQVCIGANKEHGHILGVIKTVEPFDWEEVKAKLQIENRELKTAKGKAYYMGKVDFLAEFLSDSMPAAAALKNQAAVCKLNAHTFVYGDESTVKDLLDNPPTPPPAEKKPAPAQTAGAGQGPAPTPPPQNTGGGSAAMAFDPSRTVNTGEGGGVAGVPASGDTAKSEAREYRRIDARLRQVIEAAQENAQPLGLFADSAAPGRLGKKRSPVASILFLRDMPAMQIDQVEIVALAVPPHDGSGNPTLRAALLCRDRRDSDNVRREAERVLVVAKDRLKDLFGFDFQVGEAKDGAAGSSGNAFGPAGGGGAPPPPPPPAAPPTRGGGGSSMSLPPPPGQPSQGAGSNAFNPSSVGDKKEEKPVEKLQRGMVELSRADELVIIVASIHDKKDDFFENQIGNFMVKLRGEGEIASGKVRVGDLAQGYTLFRNSLSASGEPAIAPLGVAKRAPNAARGPRPYPPSDCVSWMPGLLNYLPGDRYQNLASEVDGNASWRDPKNVGVGRILISPFLNPSLSNPKVHVRVRGVEQPLAVTDFVGMAGVGPDAPYYDKSDRRAGIFGYYRQTRMEDVKDGLENTIYMIQSDASVTGPWIAGGGSTVRGTSENGDRDVGVPGGFSSPVFKGKPGVWVVMADGSARFLTKDISPAAFKAMCTMAGGDDAGELDLTAPKQKLEVTPFTPSQTQNQGKPAAPVRPRSTIRDDD